ncbi:hypothetical protein HDU93_000721 [Gonapodya sp. JEL0774]|nr:hypothetical protein HDU93_000721 [Gonapodya sp. JEL0774]
MPIAGFVKGAAVVLRLLQEGVPSLGREPSLKPIKRHDHNFFGTVLDGALKEGVCVQGTVRTAAQAQEYTDHVYLPICRSINQRQVLLCMDVNATVRKCLNNAEKSLTSHDDERLKDGVITLVHAVR